MFRGWTAGQWALVRVSFGAALAVLHFARLFRTEVELSGARWMLELGTALFAGLVALGLCARPAAVGALCLEFALSRATGLEWIFSASCVGFVAVAVADADPWSLRAFPRTQAWPWRRSRLSWILPAGFLVASVARLAWIDRAPTPAEIALWVLFAAPWFAAPVGLASRAASGGAVLFFDGQCGVCHGVVRFALLEGAAERGWRFAPLQGKTAAQRLSGAERARAGDSVIVRSAHGRVLSRSAAVLELFGALGGLWRILAGLAQALPARGLDFAYDAIALRRKRWSRAPSALCPIVPRELAASFDP